MGGTGYTPNVLRQQVRYPDFLLRVRVAQAQNTALNSELITGKAVVCLHQNALSSPLSANFVLRALSDI
jgi:hypothetical protein